MAHAWKQAQAQSKTTGGDGATSVLSGFTAASSTKAEEKEHESEEEEKEDVASSDEDED